MIHLGVDTRLMCFKSEWWGRNTDLESRNMFRMGNWEKTMRDRRGQMEEDSCRERQN